MRLFVDTLNIWKLY